MLSPTHLIPVPACNQGLSEMGGPIRATPTPPLLPVPPSFFRPLPASPHVSPRCPNSAPFPQQLGLGLGLCVTPGSSSPRGQLTPRTAAWPYPTRLPASLGQPTAEPMADLGQDRLGPWLFATCQEPGPSSGLPPWIICDTLPPSGSRGDCQHSGGT